MGLTLDTIKSRLKLAFPDQEDWLKSPAIFTDKSLLIAGHQVMQKWESNYMKSLASIAVKNGGNVLEVGYGLGISANFIQQLGGLRLKKHYIIEAHPDVAKLAKKDFAKEIKSGRVVICEDFWENAAKGFADNFFDGILFDTYPLRPEEIHKNHYKFFKTANRILKKGGILTYYSDEADGFSKEHKEKLQKAGFTEYSYRQCRVKPSKDCIYWDKKILIAPIVVK